MKDLSIPVPNFGEKEIADIELRIGAERIQYSFRVESFPWDVEDDLNIDGDEITRSLARIHRLKRAIESYDPEWELIQILTPDDNARFIQVLYRKRKKI
jgi:hypothetical protein